MSTEIDDSEKYGYFQPGPVRKRVHSLLNSIYKCGWLGRRIFGRLQWLEVIFSSRTKHIVDADRFGLRWRLYRHDNVSEKRLLLRPDSFEPVEIDAILGMVRPGFIFIDVGANCGFYSLRIANALGGKGRIVAIEPHPVVRQRFEYNVNINTAMDITIYSCVIGDHNGKVKFEEGIKNLGTNRVSEKGTIDVEMRTLLDVVADERLGRIDAIKVDVEGYEDRVLDPFLRDAPESLLPRMIVAEFSWNDSWESDWLVRAATRGYKEKTRTRNQNVILVRA